MINFNMLLLNLGYCLKRLFYAFIGLIILSSCKAQIQPTQVDQEVIKVGAEYLEEYVEYIEEKKVGLVINHTSLIGNTHLLDSLSTLGIDIVKVFAPEHGFRGEADAGALVEDGIDLISQLPIISLYGKNKKPSDDQLRGIDIMIFDIQDVGVRFYTYLSTLHYIMEACAENSIPLIVLDRPNPNGHYIDGPVMKDSFTSFVGLHPVPIVYGMSIGEYARMIQGEKWIHRAQSLDLKVIPCQNYTHASRYELPIKPSPNLPNIRSILLYPSLCLFEGTELSIGRGTTKQFQLIGHPSAQSYDFVFSPEPMAGAQYPKHKGIACYGLDLSSTSIDSLYAQGQLDFQYLVDFYQELDAIGNPFFLKTDFFEKLAGTDILRKQLKEKIPYDQIRASWTEELDRFKSIREKYLLYD